MAEKDFRVRKGLVVDGTSSGTSVAVTTGNVVIANGTLGLTDGLLLSTVSGTPNVSKITSQPTNGNIHIEPNGTGDIVLVTDTLDTTGDALTFKVKDNDAAGLNIATADDSYIKLVTTNSSEELNLAGGFGLVTIGDGTAQSFIEAKDSLHDAAGKKLTISGGSTTPGTTNNIAGGNLVLQGGQGKGNATGGSIVFKVADGGASGPNLNSYATAITISDDTGINFHSSDMTNVDINSGTIDGTTVGAASASTGKFTTLKALTTGYISRVNALQSTTRFQVDGLDTGAGAGAGTSPSSSSTAAYAEARLFSDLKGDDYVSQWNDYSGMSGTLIIDNADDVPEVGQGTVLTIGDTGGNGDSWAMGRMQGSSNSDFTIGYYPKPYEDIGYKNSSSNNPNDFNPFRAAQSVFKIEKTGDVTLKGIKGDTVDGSTAAHIFNPVSLKFQGVDSGGNTRFAGFTIPSQLAASNSIYTLPTGYPGSNKVLQSTSAGVLSWISASGTISALNNQSENRLVTIGSTTTELDGEAKATLDGHKMLLGEQSGTGKTTSSNTNPHLHIVRRQDVDIGSGVGDQILGARIQAIDVADGHNASHGVSVTGLNVSALQTNTAGGTSATSKALQLSATGSTNNYAIYSSAGDAYFQSSVDNTPPQLTLAHIFNDTSGPVMNFLLDKGAAGAADDVLGQILFKGDDADQNTTTYAAIKADVASATADSEEGRLTFQMAQQSDGSLIDVMVIDGGNEADGTSSKVVIKGDLQVDGDTTTVNTATLEVEDLNITVAKNAADSSAADGAGLTVAGASATFNYSHSGTKWTMNKPLDVTGAVTATTSFIIGSADLNETDLEKLDGITNGTVAANKAVVVNGDKDASSFRNLTAVNLTGSTSLSTPLISTDHGDIKTFQRASGSIAQNTAVTLFSIDSTTHRGAEVLTTVYNDTEDTTDLFKTVIMWDGHDTTLNDTNAACHYTNYAVLSSGDVTSGEISAVKNGANIDVKFTTKDSIGTDTYVVRGQVILLDI